MPIDRRSVLLLASLSSLAPVAVVGCEGVDEVPDHHAHDGAEEESLGVASSALDTDPVSSLVQGGCTSVPLKGLSTQLIEEVECLAPNTMKRIDKTPGLTLGNGALISPFLQTAAADALVAAQKARGVTMQINSGLRSLPHQYILYRWYQTNRCNIRLAARPGTSNHESGLAVDINDNAAWRSAMAGKNYRWLGANDPVHFDYIGGGTVSLTGLSVRAFQRLWNRNNPGDMIAEDGSYGPQTEARLAKSPVGGFAKGATCKDPPPAPDAGVVTPPVEEPEPVEPEPEVTEPKQPKRATADAGGELAALGDEGGGCSVGPARGDTRGALWAPSLALALAAVARVRLRRRVRRSES